MCGFVVSFFLGFSEFWLKGWICNSGNEKILFQLQSSSIFKQKLLPHFTLFQIIVAVIFMYKRKAKQLQVFQIQITQFKNYVSVFLFSSFHQFNYEFVPFSGFCSSHELFFITEIQKENSSLVFFLYKSPRFGTFCTFLKIFVV